MKRMVICLLLGCLVALSGCDKLMKKGEVPEATPTPVPEGRTVTWETAGDGVSEEELASGTYYVLHDGKYYAAYTYKRGYTDGPGDAVDRSRVLFYTSENEKYIPTLFLGQGDKLIYYSEVNLLDYIVWERFADFGYTLGVYGVDSMVNGRCYIELDSDNPHILDDSELYEAYGLGVENILFDKIGGVQVMSDFLKYGLLMGLNKDMPYDLEIYMGTLFRHYATTANIHAYNAMELFASVEYETKQERIYEIAIPEYFIDGYYMVNGTGLVRIVTGESYEIPELNEKHEVVIPGTDWNVPLLWMPEGTEDSTGGPAMYSEFPVLNRYSNLEEGTLGYLALVDGLLPGQEEEEVPIEDILGQIQQATVTRNTLYFPKDTECAITIHSTEKTGDCYVSLGDKTYQLVRTIGADEVTYSVTLSGKGQDGTLTVSGFLKPVTVELVGCTNASEGGGSDGR